MTVRALDRGIYEPLTNWELRTAIVVLNAMMQTGEVPLSRVTGALKQKGFPSRARAKLAIEMVLLPGGPPTTKLGMIVAKDAARLSTPELFALIKHHCPGTSIEEMSLNFAAKARHKPPRPTRWRPSSTEEAV
jgi:hypothetical protein